MIIRILLAGLLGGAILFGWGAFSHMVLQLGDTSLKELPNEETVLSSLRDNVPEGGLYFFPYGDHSMSAEAQASWLSRYQRGPSGLLVYSPRNYKEPMGPEQLGLQFGIDVALAILAAMLLAQAAPALQSYVQRIFFILLVGLIAGIAVPLPYWNWYGFPSDFTLAAVTEQVVGFTLAGLAIAAIVRRRPVAATEPATV